MCWTRVTDLEAMLNGWMHKGNRDGHRCQFQYGTTHEEASGCEAVEVRLADLSQPLSFTKPVALKAVLSVLLLDYSRD